MEPSRNPSGSKEKNMLRILLSQNPRRNLDFCLSELAQFTKEGFSRRAFFLVPEEIKLDTERRYLEHFDRRGLMIGGSPFFSPPGPSPFQRGGRPRKSEPER